MHPTALDSAAPSGKFAGLIASHTFRACYQRGLITGRPTKLTEDLIADLVEEYTLAPIGRDAVCDKIGISDETRRRWFKQAHADEASLPEDAPPTPHMVFRGVFKRARGYWQSMLLQGVLQGSQQWTAYMTLLERIWPEEYARRPEANGPAVLVQVGGSPTDVKVLIATSGPVNGIPHYQTRQDSEPAESLSLPATFATPPTSTYGDQPDAKSVPREAKATRGPAATDQRARRRRRVGGAR